VRDAGQHGHVLAYSILKLEWYLRCSSVFLSLCVLIITNSEIRVVCTSRERFTSQVTQVFSQNSHGGLLKFAVCNFAVCSSHPKN